MFTGPPFLLPKDLTIDMKTHTIVTQGCRSGGKSMTKTNLVGALVAAAMLFSMSSGVANAKSEIPTAKTGVSMMLVKQSDTTPKKKKWKCNDVLAKRLYAGGFRGENLREAWAIAMRESGGNPRSISSTGDYGIFQFNLAAHGKQDWWVTPKMLNPQYNIKVAYEMSNGGRTWYPWDIDGRGNHKGGYTSTSTYNKYKQWYNKYPCK